MSQLSFFDSPREELPPRPANPDFIRKHLKAALRLMGNAEKMPWSTAEAGNWQKQFPELVKLLPDDEGALIQAQFDAEWARLNSK